ncbi:hypothetical protein F5144DRAFT_567597 [Chaetomium tenue]|uniref:Uncharacterized protein n=1 Tax=Chaetomium tenue TaxID=1854479 RepID=A0ACB7PBA9_9PEZI|nr:hypothetical protein F5144DRAFT_567597 [Chaetomium globosum]
MAGIGVYFPFVVLPFFFSLLILTDGDTGASLQLRVRGWGMGFGVVGFYFDHYITFSEWGTGLPGLLS